MLTIFANNCSVQSHWELTQTAQTSIVQMLIANIIFELSICFQLPYTMSVDISNPSALSSSLNISQAGEIPVGGLQTWALALHCAPYDAEIDLNLRINVSLSRRNTTSLEFRRKKICLKDKSNIGDEEVLVAASGSSSGGQVFYAAIGCACAFIAAIFVLVIAYYVRDKKARRHRDPLQ